MHIYKIIPKHLHFSKTLTDMPSIESPTTESNMEEITKEDPSMDIDIQELYQNIVPETSSTASIAPWLVPILDHHKNRIIRLSKNAELGRTNVHSLIELRNSNKLPHFISSIQAPQVIEGLPDLQNKWNEVHNQYQKELFKFVPSLSILKIKHLNLISQALSSKPKKKRLKKT
jgi:hypothetical protein